MDMESEIRCIALWVSTYSIQTEILHHVQYRDGSMNKTVWIKYTIWNKPNTGESPKPQGFMGKQLSGEQ